MHRTIGTLASYALVVTATLGLTFAQTPTATRSRSRAAIEQKLASRKLPLKARLGQLRDWQRTRQRQVGQPFDQPAQAMVYFLEKRVPAGQSSLAPEDYAAALEQAGHMPIYSTDLQQFLPQRSPSGDETAAGGSVVTSVTSAPGAWEGLGPGNVGGRTRALLIHPTNPDVMWAGGVAGGIWKTTNGGQTWVPKADLLVNIAVNSMLLDPRNPDVLYAGTGEGFFNADAVRGAGILKSTDGGETWTQLPSTRTPDFFYVQKIVMSRGSSQRLYAATRTGVFRSTDGGGTWAKVHDGTAVNGCMDLAIQTDRALAFVFAACGTFAQARVVRAVDTAATPQAWSTVFSPAGMGRTSLAIAPSNQNIIYAMAAQVGGGTFADGLHGVYRSTASGAAGSWTTRVTNASAEPLNRVLLSNPVFAFLATCGFGTANQFLNQGWYDNALAVDPKDPNVVWAGGIDLFRSDDGGANWGQASHWWFTAGVDREYNHADHHLLVFHPRYDGASNKIMYSANDGGIYRTDDARAPVSLSPAPISAASPVCGNTSPGVLAWTPLNNGYQTTQFYHGAVFPNGRTFFGGTQDNGTVLGTITGGPDAWGAIRGGDGGYVAVNPANTSMLFAENTNLSLVRSLNGGLSWASFTSGITEPSGNFLFITPFAQDPTNPSRMWIGGGRVWRTAQATAVPTSGNVWQVANRGANGTAGGLLNGARVSALSISPLSSDRVYAGTQAISAQPAISGVVLSTGEGTTATGTTTWTSGKPRPGINYVSWVQADPAQINVVYATISTFNDAVGQGHVFKSTDFGATWTNIDGSGATAIPDVPVHCILVDPDDTQRLWVGTDIGVFVSLDGGQNWARENTGFANVITESLSLGTENGVTYIYAFTHGRSLFRIRKPGPVTTTSAP